MAAKKGKRTEVYTFCQKSDTFFVLKYCLDLNKLKTF